ncbi:MAG: hypothetical protein ISN29_02185 [Gammaproteobacteria bacterium AqS3]|nr:hypothetical protein [Gammaproteobacteria bacterium AqS3]
MQNARNASVIRQPVTPAEPHPLRLPEPISPERVRFLIDKGIDAAIAGIDLEMVKMKLAEPGEGIGWSPAQCEDAEIEYKRYLTLCVHYPHPDYSIVPNKIMDTMWHYHILDTRAYCRDCDRVFGGYFHHYPYFGLRGDDDERALKAAFEDTKTRYGKLFGEPMCRGGESDCWHDCEDRCWHACK